VFPNAYQKHVCGRTPDKIYKLIPKEDYEHPEPSTFSLTEIDKTLPLKDGESLADIENSEVPSSSVGIAGEREEMKEES
jgi:hypothetical protein